MSRLAATLLVLAAAAMLHAQAPPARTAGDLSKLGPQVGTAGRGGAAQETAHLAVATRASDRRVAPGTRLALFVDVTPKPKMHVYAPQQKDVIPVSLALEAGEFAVHPPRFPTPEKYFFKPLDETQLVFSRPFRIVQEITVALTPAVRERAREAGSIAVAGTLKYQACDDAICYMPQSVPVTWTIGLKPLVAK